MKYDAILFDLDGTLTESEPGILNSVKYALEKMGREPLPDEKLRAFIGPPLSESFQKVAGMNAEDAEEAVAKYRERFSVVGWKENSVYPGIACLLRSLKEQGAYVALATAKPLPFTEKIVEFFGLAPYLDRVEAATLANHDSSKAGLVRRALPEKYERACMVGDRCYDVEGALANGIDGIGVLYGYGSREELTASGAAYVAESVADLTVFLLDGAAPARGPFITFEGPDGCGKSTQVHRAKSWLESRGYVVRMTREPGGCPVSERIRELVLDVKNEGMTARCEALLFAASRAQHVETVIEPALSRGEAVLSDRFVDASYVYQGAGRHLGLDTVMEINAPAVKGLKPDITLFMNIDPMKAMTRRLDAASPDRIEKESRDFVNRVYEAYRELARREPERIYTVNADQTVDEVAGEVAGCLERALRGFAPSGEK